MQVKIELTYMLVAFYYYYQQCRHHHQDHQDPNHSFPSSSPLSLSHFLSSDSSPNPLLLRFSSEKSRTSMNINQAQHTKLQKDTLFPSY